MHKCRRAGLIRCTSSCCFVFLNILFCYHIMLQSTENSRYDQNDSCKVWPRLFARTLTYLSQQLLTCRCTCEHKYSMFTYLWTHKETECFRDIKRTWLSSGLLKYWDKKILTWRTSNVYLLMFVFFVYVCMLAYCHWSHRVFIEWQFQDSNLAYH